MDLDKLEPDYLSPYSVYVITSSSSSWFSSTFLLFLLSLSVFNVYYFSHLTFSGEPFEERKISAPTFDYEYEAFQHFPNPRRAGIENQFFCKLSYCGSVFSTVLFDVKQYY